MIYHIPLSTVCHHRRTTIPTIIGHVLGSILCGQSTCGHLRASLMIHWRRSIVCWPRRTSARDVPKPTGRVEATVGVLHGVLVVLHCLGEDLLDHHAGGAVVIRSVLADLAHVLTLLIIALLHTGITRRGDVSTAGIVLHRKHRRRGIATGTHLIESGKGIGNVIVNEGTIPGSVRGLQIYDQGNANENVGVKMTMGRRGWIWSRGIIHNVRSRCWVLDQGRDLALRMGITIIIIIMIAGNNHDLVDRSGCRELVGMSIIYHTPIRRHTRSTTRISKFHRTISIILLVMPRRPCQTGTHHMITRRTIKILLL